MATTLPSEIASNSHRLHNVVAAESIDSAMDCGDNILIRSGETRRSQSRDDVTYHLQRHLKYFFMNPCQKYRAKRKYPHKLVLQIVKVVLVTVQLVLFGVNRASHVDFLEKSNIAFKHLYLLNWSASYETMPYPPSTGAFAIYTTSDFYNSVDFALNQYQQTEQIAIGTYSFANEDNIMEPPQLCTTLYRQGQVFAFNRSFVYDPTVVNECTKMLPTTNGTYSSRDYLAAINKTILFDRLMDATLNMSVRTVHLKGLSQLSKPDCYQFDIKIKYDNADHNGQMAVELLSPEQVLMCNGTIDYIGMNNTGLIVMSIFDVIVIITSILSIVLCGRSIYRAFLLGKQTGAYFSCEGRQPLSSSEFLEFVNFWYIMIIVNDMLTIGGCIVKIQIENKASVSYEVCGVLLGTANLLVWCGVLRYLGFFHKYNVLIRTIKQSAPNVLRFLICAFVFYFGFAICGWVVLGPYHLKFRKLSTASECLFSLINGDDIFTTFATTSDVNSVMWWYSRVYLYFFVSLFIYVILSVFISVIMDTYETIKKEYAMGIVQNRLHAFADECKDRPHELFADEMNGCTIGSCTFCLDSLCCRRSEPASRDEPNEYSPLVS